MVQHARDEKKRSIVQKKADLEEKLQAARRREHQVRQRQESGQPFSKKRKLDQDPDQAGEVGDEFILDDYESDDNAASATKRDRSATDLGLSKETQALMDKLGFSVGLPAAKDEILETEDELKIFFCSRTHSQLTQFVGEIRRIQLPPAIPAEDEVSDDVLTEGIKHITLGSRRNLCINPKVSSLKHPTAINERCLELQDSKTSVDKKCSFVPTKDNEGEVLDFQHYALSKIRDIEDLGTIGKKLGICPYYATRPTVKPSEVGLRSSKLLNFLS